MFIAMSNMNGKIMHKLRQLDANKNWHGVFDFKKLLATLTDQEESIAGMLVSLLAKHARYCVKKNCRYRKTFGFREIDKLYSALILKDPSNDRLKIDRVYFRYGHDADKYIEAMKKVVKQTGEKKYHVMIGHAYAGQKRFRLARKHFLLAAPFIADHYGIYYALAKNAQNLNDKKAEVEYARMALARFKLMPRKYQHDPVTDVFINELKAIIKNRGK